MHKIIAQKELSTPRRPNLHGIESFLQEKSENYIKDDQGRNFRVKCPKCKSSSSRAFIKFDATSFYCMDCKVKGDWNLYKSYVVKNYIPGEPTYLTNLGYNFSMALPNRTYYELKEFPDLLNKLIQKENKRFLTLETMEKFWLCFSKLNLPNKSSMEDTNALFFPKTCQDSVNNFSKFKAVELKALTLPDKSTTLYSPEVHKEFGLFGYQNVKLGDDAVILVSNEFDAMAIYQHTGIPTVSLPKNFYQLPIQYLSLLSHFERIYIWFPKNVNGENASTQFAHKLGLNRSFIVKMTGLEDKTITTPYEAFFKGENITKMLEEAQLFQHEQLITFENLSDSLNVEIMNPEQSKGVPSTDLPGFNSILKGLRPGELTIFSGPTGSGKTTFLAQMSLDFCKSGVPTLWGSFEISNIQLAKKLLFQNYGKVIEPNAESYNRASIEFSKLPMYFMKFFGSTSVKSVIDAMEHAIHAYDIQHVIIDNLQFMTSGLGKGFERWEIQDDALSSFRKFATQHNVHVTLVVHPRKDDSDFLSINSIFGSAKVTQEADNVIIIQKTDSSIRFDGTVGHILVKYDPITYKSRQLTKAEIDEMKKGNDIE